MEREYLLITQASPKRLKNKRQEQEFVKKLGLGHVLLYVLVPLPDIKMGPPWVPHLRRVPVGQKTAQGVSTLSHPTLRILVVTRGLPILPRTHFATKTPRATLR